MSFIGASNVGQKPIMRQSTSAARGRSAPRAVARHRSARSTARSPKSTCGYSLEIAIRSGVAFSAYWSDMRQKRRESRRPSDWRTYRFEHADLT